MPKITVIDTAYGVLQLNKYLADKDVIAYDIETDGLPMDCTVIGTAFCAALDAAFYVVTHKWNIDKGVLIADDAVINANKNLLETIKTKALIMHNGIFDCSRTERFYKVSLIESLHTDTMVLAHLLNENRRIGLKELAKEYFGEDSTKAQAEMKASVIANGGKLTKAQYEMYKCDWQIMAKYGAMDAWLTYRLFYELVPELLEQGLEDFFYQDECMPLLRGPTYQLNTTGLKVDLKALTTLKKTLEAECAEAKAFIYQEIAAHVKDKYPGTTKANTFNIGSGAQLSWLLFGQLRLEFNVLTDSGKNLCKSLGIKPPYTAAAKRDFIAICHNSFGDINTPEAIVNGKKVRAKKIKEPWTYTKCDKKTLQKYADRYAWIAKLLEYKRKSKLLTTYVMGIEKQAQYGIIRPSFLQTGTTSGRYASRSPNFQNLPRDDKRIKATIVARPGKVLIGADYSQLEPRVFAYYSKDERLLAAFDGTSDFYSVIGMGVYDKIDCTPQKEGSPDAFGIKYKKLRDLSKVIALASTYGATAHQLAPTTGKSVDDTQQDMDNYFENFPGVANMMLEAHKIVKSDGQVVNHFGRPRRIPDAKKIDKIYGDIPHREYPYEVRTLLNLAVNHRIQGTGASIVNRAAIRYVENAKLAGLTGCPLVLQVHDSLVIECDAADADSVTLLLEDAMIHTVQLEGIALEAIPKTGNTLAEV